MERKVRKDGFLPISKSDRLTLRRLWYDIYGEKGLYVFMHSVEDMNQFNAWNTIKQLKKTKEAINGIKRTKD